MQFFRLKFRSIKQSYDLPDSDSIPGLIRLRNFDYISGNGYGQIENEFTNEVADNNHLNAEHKQNNTSDLEQILSTPPEQSAANKIVENVATSLSNDHPASCDNGKISKQNESTVFRKSEDLLQCELSPPTQNIRRKGGIISGRIEQITNKDIHINTYEKDKSTEVLITEAIKNNDFLHNMLSDETLKIVVKAMVPKELDVNSYIIKEGEVGAQFFVSDQGEFDVIKEGKTIKKFGRGEVFGELAVLYQATRFASIKATTSAKIWMLEGKIFKKIMIKTNYKERELNIQFLKSVPDFQGLSWDVLQKIGDLLKREFYPTGSTIIRQGDIGDKFYIIRGGQVTVHKAADKESRIVKILRRGDYFGEQALITQERRLASVIANEPGTECLTIDRINFNKFLGELSELKKKPVDQSSELSAKQSVINKAYDHIQFNELDVIGTLGSGGYGRVELVQYKKNLTFALKSLKKYEVVNQGKTEHAYSEKDTMAMCNSPFIVKLYKTYRNRKYIYFLMEVCLGGDVFSQLQKQKCFNDKAAKFIASSVIEAFHYLHSKNIIYRDLKPENLMLDSDGYVKLGDFGFAKQLKPNQKTWTFAGTPEYVAPEVILNKGHDRSADYWTLGILIHELLVGQPPFTGKNHMKVYNSILNGIESIAIMSPKIVKSAQNLIRSLCRNTPAERLGYLKNGFKDIKNHSWFDDFDWEKLRTRSIVSPVKTMIRSNTDLSNFAPEPYDRDEPPDETSGWDINF